MKRGYKETEIGEIPEEWGVVQIDSILESNDNSLRIGPFGSQLKKTLLVDSGYKVYGQENVFTNNFSIGNRFISQAHWELLKSFRVKPHDILVTMMGTIGKTTIVPDDIVDGIIDSHLIRISLNNGVVDNAFFIQQFSSPLVKKQLAKLSVGGIMDGLSTKIIKKVFYSLPPLPEQKKITDVLTSVDESIRATQAVIEQAKVLKQGMLNQLLTKGIGHKKFKQTEIGEIPEEWEVKKVKDVFKLGRGRVISRPYIQEHSGEYPVFSSQTSDNGIMGFIDTFDFEGEYITWTTDGAKAGEVFYRTGKFNCTNVCGTAKCKQGNINLSFMAYYLNIEAKKHVVHVGNDKLMNNIFGEIDIVIPKLSEQKKIGETLSSFDEMIQQSNIRIYNLQRLKSGLMQDLLSGKKRVKV